MTPETWKGEHLIRSQRQPKKPLICDVPKCKAVLDKTNQSGVCRKHIHSKFCKCSMCDKRR